MSNSGNDQGAARSRPVPKEFRKMTFAGVDWFALKARITLVTLVIFVFGVWSSALFISWMLKGDMQHQLGEQEFSTTTMVAKGIDEEERGLLLN